MNDIGFLVESLGKMSAVHRLPQLMEQIYRNLQAGVSVEEDEQMCATRLQTEPRHDRYLSQIKTILASVFENQECTIYLFGSRARGTSATVSDFDIAVVAAEDISRELSLAREMLELSNIPFTVDLVDLRAAGAALNRQVQTEGILLWKN